MNCHATPHLRGCRGNSRGFTLIELLTVIAIIAVLMGLLFPAVSGAMEQARKAQAKNGLMSVIQGVKAYYTDYGTYPCDANTTDNDASDYFTGDDNKNDVLFNILRSQKVNNAYTPEQDTYNPRRVVYLDLPLAKNLTAPKNGIGGNGRFYDPWGGVYRVRIDNNYNNQVTNPYTSNAGFNPLPFGVISWALGKDGAGATAGTGGGDRKTGTYLDDVLSWD